jgi:hypothetical protein
MTRESRHEQKIKKRYTLYYTYIIGRNICYETYMRDYDVAGASAQKYADLARLILPKGKFLLHAAIYERDSSAR